MTTKQEWTEYFKLMNAREPSPQEIQQATANGEIQEQNRTEQNRTEQNRTEQS